MNIDVKDILTLSDKKEYVVVSKALYDGKEYLYLIDINNDSNFKFCYIDNDEVVESNNKELNTKLIPLFYEFSNNLFQ